MARLAVITDCDLNGSGYLSLMMPLLTKLSEMGHDIKVAALGYTGGPHPFPFSLIPCKDLQDTASVVNNLHFLWQYDVALVGLDIPLQIQMHSTFRQFNKPYVAITPLENGPLTMTWAAAMFSMDHIFFISELGKQEAMKVGLTKVDHLYVGVDTESWRLASEDERKQIRQGLGIGEDEFVILSVADNQERKNLSAALEIVSGLKKEIGEKKVRYLLVTREHNPFGWKLRDLAVRLDISKELNIFERGMPRDRLWGLYAASDVYLNTSKAEGLGMPVLDAMAMKIPVVATDTGALHELLEDNRGFLIKPVFTFIDVWGNSQRDMIYVPHAVSALKELYGEGDLSALRELTSSTTKAYEYVKSRTWELPATQVHNVIERLTVK